MKTLSLVILSLFFNLPVYATNATNAENTQNAGIHAFRLNSGSTEALSRENGAGFYNQLSAEIFKRMNIKLSFIRLPSKRSLIHANKGIDDGNIARVKGMEKKWANLMRVPESVLTWEFTAYSNDGNIKLNGWESLKPYSVGHIRGWQIYKKKAVIAKSVIEANNTAQLFELLKTGRIDIALFERFQAPYWFNKIGFSAKAASTPLAVKPLYIYLHKKHKKLIPKMAKVISEIKLDGTYKKIFDRTLNPNK